MFSTFVGAQNHPELCRDKARLRQFFSGKSARKQQHEVDVPGRNFRIQVPLFFMEPVLKGAAK